VLAPPPRSGRRTALLNRSLTFEEERDRVQHHIVAAVAYKDDPRLVFKGGTMLRVCGLPDYRWPWSEPKHPVMRRPRRGENENRGRQRGPNGPAWAG